MPDRDVLADLEAADRFLLSGRNGLDVVKALAAAGHEEIADNLLRIQRLRVSGDLLQTSAILVERDRVLSAVNDPNDYHGPDTGYRLGSARQHQIAAVPQAVDPRLPCEDGAESGRLRERGEAQAGTDPSEVVIALGPAFGSRLNATILGLPHSQVLRALIEGVRAEAMVPRVVKIYATSDCGFIGYAGARLSGSGVAIGIQSKGTTVIHRRDLEPLNTLELFPQAPLLTIDSYRAIGSNAARYAKLAPVRPVPLQIDNMTRLKHIVRTTILHLVETEQVVRGKPAQEIKIDDAF
jgi:propanediol dehydratase large subunit